MSLTLDSSVRNILLKNIVNQLIFSQKKLNNQRMPWHLRVSSYLRIGCSALSKYQKLQPDTVFLNQDGISYLRLLEALSLENSRWWEDCYVSSAGILEAKNRNINRLIKPLKNLYKSIELYIDD